MPTSTEDLKKKRASNESFWLIGRPDVQVERIADGPDKGKLRVLSMASTTTTPRRVPSTQEMQSR